MSAPRISTAAQIDANTEHGLQWLEDELAALSEEVRRKGRNGLCLCDVGRLGKALREYARDADGIIKEAAK